MSSPAATFPYSVGSARVASMPFLDLTSQTPSQFHSPGFLAAGIENSVAVLSLSSDFAAAASSLAAGASNIDDFRSLSWTPLFIRCVRQACHAPVLPAASNGMLSSTRASSKVLRIYLSTSYVDTRCGRVSRGGGASVDTGVSRPLALLSSGSADGLPVDAYCALLCLLFAALRLARPNQAGKPCRRLKPPGGNLSSSVALTVPEPWISVVYVRVDRGVMRGWNMSVSKITNGGSEGYSGGNDIRKRRMAGL